MIPHEQWQVSGQAPEADEEPRRAVAVAQECRTRGSQAWAFQLLGEVAAPATPRCTLRAATVDALVLAEELGMRSLVAHCHLGLGKLYRRTGQRHRAREHVTTATGMYREMAMRFWLNEAEDLLRDLA